MHGVRYNAVSASLSSKGRTSGTPFDSEPITDAEKSHLWRQRFFEAQASAEEIFIQVFGYAGLESWIRMNAQIAARLISRQMSAQENGARAFAKRLATQLRIYDSPVRIQESESILELQNPECGILRYRKEAQSDGVVLTFQSPCDYCQGLNSAIYEALSADGRTAAAQLSETGCTWRIEQ